MHSRKSSVDAFLSSARKKTFYSSLHPMLATLVDEPVDDDDWLYEIKWDGYRALAFKNKAKLELKSRNDKSFNEKFYPVYDAVKKLKINAILDGEIAVLNEQGGADFGSLQNWRSEADGDLVFYVFDILWYEGYDLTKLPLADRREILQRVVVEGDVIRISKSFNTTGTEFLEAARKMGLEGIMAKRKASVYVPGERTKDWLKIKANKRQEVVIGGYTKNNGSAKPFSALLVGVFEKGRFVYTGKVGTGFSVKTQQQMLKQFRPFIIKKPAFYAEPDINKPSRFRPNPPEATATWLKPQLVCEVSFAEITSDGVMRHPSFEGMRDDKNAKQVVAEKELKTTSILKKKAAKARGK